MKLKVTIDGKTYEVDVEATEPETRRPGYLPPAGGATPTVSLAEGERRRRQSAAAQWRIESKVFRSPIAGIVVKVSAQVGQAIQANDVLIVLEAMKMETTITSPVAGKIAKVNASVGDPVQGVARS